MTSHSSSPAPVPAAGSALAVVPAAEAGRPVLERLWQLFRHDMSAFTDELPDAHGRFRHERLDRALDPAEPGWCAYLLRVDERPVGFAVVRGVDAPGRVVNSFFLVRAARRGGHGTSAVERITTGLPGPWAVAFQDANLPAARFWPAVAARLDPDFALERRAVPGRPDAPPDTWVRFRAGRVAAPTTAARPRR